MISEIIEKWIKGILIDGITGNLSGLFDNVNAKVGEIASDVGSTPQAWNSGIFNMLRSLSETVVLPIAAAILALVMCHELIQMITEKNNMHDFDTSMFFRWIFKSAFAILIVSNTWNIVMGVFDATQSVVNQSSGVIIGETSIHFDRLIPGLEFQLESMTIGSLLSLWFQTLVVGLTMNILSICIFLVTYGRMIEIYVVTALGPIPLATMGSSEWRSTGQNYLNEGKKNFYCGNRGCQFVMWKNDRFFEQRKKAFTPKIAAALLKNGKAKVKGLYSEKTGKTYDATVLLADTGGKYVNYRVERKE